MARPPRLGAQRSEFLPLLADAFASAGYRRTTTAELARRCGVQETILYRLWPDKRAMFLAAIDYVFTHSQQVFAGVLAGDGRPATGRGATLLLLDHQAEHLGDLRHYRIVFAGLSETDDPQIGRELRRMYRRFHALIVRQLGARRPAAALPAWGILALATFATIARELGVMSAAARRRLVSELGRRLLG